jgi:hypothetical protein
MAKKFADMAVGEQFEALGERYVKSGPLTYRSIDNPTMGEYNAGPILDRQIGVEPRSTIRGTVKVTKDPELDSTNAAIAAGQVTPITNPVIKKAKKKS